MIRYVLDMGREISVICLFAVRVMTPAVPLKLGKDCKAISQETCEPVRGVTLSNYANKCSELPAYNCTINALVDGEIPISEDKGILIGLDFWRFPERPLEPLIPNSNKRHQPSIVNHRFDTETLLLTWRP